MVKISELRAREVINVTDGRRLGPIKDIDVDLEEGRISAIILPTYGTRLIGLFSREQEIVIPWDKIVRIGVDVILVELSVPQEAHAGGYYYNSRGW
ncbi:MAG: YlmC/YmxH family sporulation protein [Peptococcaceae bacterium]|nr:YlmC/YmxH family sporulation protein [Peptococcaceae bacterium]